MTINWMLFKSLWLRNSNTTNSHLAVYVFIRLYCSLPKFRRFLRPRPWGSYSLTGHPPPYLADFLPLSAYMDLGWGPNSLSVPLNKRQFIRIFGWATSSKVYIYHYIKSLTNFCLPIQWQLETEILKLLFFILLNKVFLIFWTLSNGFIGWNDKKRTFLFFQ